MRPEELESLAARFVCFRRQITRCTSDNRLHAGCVVMNEKVFERLRFPGTASREEAAAAQGGVPTILFSSTGRCALRSSPLTPALVIGSEFVDDGEATLIYVLQTTPLRTIILRNPWGRHVH